MRRPDLLSDERFATAAARSANREAVLSELRAWARTVPDFAAFETAVGSERMAAGAVRSLTQAMDEPWVAARGALVDVGDPGAPIRLPRSPFRFSDAEVGTHGRTATQGQHNGEVLTELLRLDVEEVEALEDAGVLVRRSDRTET